MKHSIFSGRFREADARGLSIAAFSLFGAGFISFPYEGQVLFALADRFRVDPGGLVLGAIIAHMAGLFAGGFVVGGLKAARRLMLGTIVLCMAGTGAFYFAPSALWDAALYASAFFAGLWIAAWGVYYQYGTGQNMRVNTAADVLIYSAIMMILINMVALRLSPYAGLSLGLAALFGALLASFRLPAPAQCRPGPQEKQSVTLPLAFLCLFIVVITISSGLMFQVINPAYAGVEWLADWYWAVPYIVAIFIVRNLPPAVNRTYILYAAIAMIGFAFIAFVALDRSAWSYFIVNTLLLGACGVNDLFWWSILGALLDYGKNPARILGLGLCANVLGVLLGKFIGSATTMSENASLGSSLIALSVVCVALVLLPPLHKLLSRSLKHHVFLSALSQMPAEEQEQAAAAVLQEAGLTEREGQVTMLLLKGRTYKMTADELHLSENTVKTHIKNIYSKMNVQSKAELIQKFVK